MGPPGAVLYLDGGVVVLNANTIAFAGYTPTAFTGNLGGFVGANAKCEAAFAGSSLCTVTDYQLANPTVSIGGVGAWIDYNRFTNGERNSSACAGPTSGQAWIDSSATSAGAVVLPTGFYASGGPAQLCNVARPLTCCR